MHRPVARLCLLAVLIAACSNAGLSPSPSPQPTPSPAPAAGFYLRAYYTQALPPRHTFNWLAALTVADGVLLDGNVAIPAIFPGPLTILPIARPISDAGIAALIAEAQRLGLLTDRTDYTGDQAMPGSRSGHIELIVDGITYNLTGNPDSAIVGNLLTIVEPALTVVELPLTVVSGSLTVVELSLTVVGGSLTVVELPLTVVGGSLTVVELPLTVVGDSLTVVELSLTVVSGSLTVVELLLTVVGGSLTVVELPLTVVGGSLTVVAAAVTTVDAR